MKNIKAKNYLRRSIALVSTSYFDFARNRNILSAFAIKSSEKTDTSIPSHFWSSSFTIGAFDNFDFEVNSSISGTANTHDTAIVLF